MAGRRDSSVWIFDTRGTRHQADSVMLRELHYAHHVAHDTAIAYFVRNMGMVRLQRTANGAIVAFRPRLVGPIAFSALLYELAERPTERLIVQYVASAIPPVVFPDFQSALGPMAEQADSGRKPPRFSDREIPVTDLSATSPLHGLIQLWRAGGHRRVDQLRNYSAEHLADRWYSVQAVGGRHIFDGIGEGLQLPDSWRRRAIGLSVDQLPDRDYSHWSLLRQRAVLQLGMPMMMAVDAEVHWPETGWVRVQYTRTLLPYAAKGRVGLFCANTPINHFLVA